MPTIKKEETTIEQTEHTETTNTEATTSSAMVEKPKEDNVGPELESKYGKWMLATTAPKCGQKTYPANTPCNSEPLSKNDGRSENFGTKKEGNGSRFNILPNMEKREENGMAPFLGSQQADYVGENILVEENTTINTHAKRSKPIRKTYQVTKKEANKSADHITKAPTSNGPNRVAQRKNQSKSSKASTAQVSRKSRKSITPTQAPTMPITQFSLSPNLNMTSIVLRNKTSESSLKGYTPNPSMVLNIPTNINFVVFTAQPNAAYDASHIPPHNPNQPSSSCPPNAQMANPGSYEGNSCNPTTPMEQDDGDSSPLVEVVKSTYVASCDRVKSS